VEFELRLNGASYEEIARAGGGILSTVTRRARGRRRMRCWRSPCPASIS
jgi:imidazolonepropionase-like amidohydrolase